MIAILLKHLHTLNVLKANRGRALLFGDGLNINIISGNNMLLYTCYFKVTTNFSPVWSDMSPDMVTMFCIWFAR